MVESKNDLVNLSMNISDLNVIYKSLEKNVIASQLEFAELEKKAAVLKQDIEKQIAMLSIMKSKLVE